MAIFLLYNLVNSLNASYEMLSEYYTEPYYSLFKSFVFNNNNIDKQERQTKIRYIYADNVF